MSKTRTRGYRSVVRRYSGCFPRGSPLVQSRFESMGSRICRLGTRGLLFLLLASSHVVAGGVSRKLLGCAGAPRGCTKPRPPPSLSMSWGDAEQNVENNELQLGEPTTAWGWASSVTHGDNEKANEKLAVGQRFEGDEMGFPEVEAQQYYKLGVLETLSQSLRGPETSLSLSEEARQSCRTIPRETIRYANLVILSRALEVTGLAETLDSEDLEATLFAPTDLAFETLAERQGITVEELLEDTEYLSKVLKLHMAPNALRTSILGASESVDTFLIGHPILVTSSDKGILVVPPGGDAAHIQLADISACNSIIHIVDHVLSYVEEWDLGMFTG